MSTPTAAATSPAEFPATYSAGLDQHRGSQSLAPEPLTSQSPKSAFAKGYFCMRKYRTIAATATAALALGGALFAAPAAQAAAPGPATLVHDGGELWYKAAPGQTNDLTISAKVEQRGDWEYVYILTFDDRYEMSIESNAAEWDECVFPSTSDRTVVQCAVEIPQNSDDSDIYKVTVRDGNDKVTIPDNSAYASIYGGPGNDVIDSASGAPVLYGEDGNDRLHGGGGVWALGPFGGKGNDTITGCAMDCYGGAGNDTLTGDAEDNNMYGDSGNDVIYGKQGRDNLHGGKGNDRVHGNRGEDRLYGEQGNDTLWGDQDNDALWGNSGNDVLYGGQGKDTLSGGTGSNKLHQ
ncbi:type I secretion target GGXGXDXXX repeat (2 copies) [Streptomyces ipomoeae 91-03]|uniref:Type I secretion target GGXGXDXXX repeat (2 copies) n=2 Tax=Streptomyces ipomoeae TaxID=103232 RepID=L1KT44_9ACTN|nr:type I secretion target GGXGXDXXX repeat (2 copies) [Streptomyces ipomoeae 91-03]